MKDNRLTIGDRAAAPWSGIVSLFLITSNLWGEIALDPTEVSLSLLTPGVTLVVEGRADVRIAVISQRQPSEPQTIDRLAPTPPKAGT